MRLLPQKLGNPFLKSAVKHYLRASFIILLIFVPHLSSAGQIEGRISLLYRDVLLLDSGGDIEVINYVGISREGLREGDWLKVVYSEVVGGVKIATELIPMPIVVPDQKYVITTAELLGLIEKGQRFVLIDSRPKERYEEGYLPGAINIPDQEFEKNIKRLPRRKKTLIVFYSDGQRCPLSLNSLKKAVSLGYQNVKVYVGGEPEWVRERNYTYTTPQYVKRQLDGNKPLLLVDVREREAVRMGHIPGSVSKRPEEMLHDEFITDYWEDPVVFYGEDGRDVSAIEAAKKALAWGYQHEAQSNANVNILEGGLKAWKDAGYGVVTGEPRTSIVYVPREGEIGFEEFKEIWYGKDEGKVILDVRTSTRLFNVHRPGVIFIVYTELHRRLSELPKDKEIIIYCSAGYRAKIAYYILKKNGYKARFLKRDLHIQRDGTIR